MHAALKTMRGFAMLLMVAMSGTAWADDADAVAGAQAAQRAAQQDRLQLDATSVTGNQELPRVMYIMPWKESGIGELSGRPVNSLLDEVLAPIDREVFQRQVRYFDQLHGETSPAVASE